MCLLKKSTTIFHPRLDSKVYPAGTTAKVHVDVQNDSSVDIENFVLKVKENDFPNMHLDDFKSNI